jgi:hypothetical protein
MATVFPIQVGGGDEFTVRHSVHGIAVIGPLPLSYASKFAKFFGKKAVMAMKVADALEATMVICETKAAAAAWLAEIISEHPNDWLRNGDTGTSSLTIYSVLADSDAHRIPYRQRERLGDTPVDPEDFGRCHRLLALKPGWADRLREVSAKYPAWAGLVYEWPRLTEIYLRDLPTGKSEELYAEMKRLVPA